MKLRIDENLMYKIVLLFAFFYDTILYYAVYVMERLPVVGGFVPYITIVIIVLASLICISNGKLQLLRTTDILFLIVVFLIVVGSMLIYSQNAEVIKTRYLNKYFIECVPYFLLGIALTTDEKTEQFILMWSRISIVIGVVYVFYMLNFGNPLAIIDDNMGLAYNYLPIVMLLQISAEKSKRISSWVLFSIGFILLMFFGTRGPILIAAAFLIFGIIKGTFFGKRRYKVLLCTLLIVIFSLLYFNFNDIMQSLSGFANSVGLSTRAFDKLLTSDFLVDKDRQTISTIVIQQIKERPIFGYGVGGEWASVNWNAHNMYLSMIHNLGFLIGGISLVGLVIISIKAYIRRENEFSGKLILMFCFIVFVQGFFGGNYLGKDVFFLLGLGLSQIRKFNYGIGRNNDSIGLV